jgi:hypothetical protein
MNSLQEDTFIYFSYGSNLLTERLQARCPSATHIGNASITGYKLVFNKKSIVDESAKANLFKTELDTDIVEGSLFEINSNEKDLLDKAEGYNKEKYVEGKSYSKGVLSVSNNSNKIPAVTYYAHIASETIGSPVYDWYFALVIAGALHHKLSEGYIKNLTERISAQADTKPKRPRRLEALSILEKAGYLTVYQELSKTIEDTPYREGS